MDYDLGHRMSPEEGTPFQPLECNPATDPNCKLTCPEAAKGCKEYTPRAFKLNEDFVAWAYYLSKDVELADSEAAQNYRALYTEEAARSDPFVDIGTMCAETATFMAQDCRGRLSIYATSMELGRTAPPKWRIMPQQRFWRDLAISIAN